MTALGRLNKIKLENYKSIASMELELGKLNILLGQNGAGKSNFISFFQLTNTILNRDLQLYVARQGVDRLLHFGRKGSQSITFDLEFLSHGYGAELIPTTADNVLFKHEYAESWPDQSNRSASVNKMALAPAGSKESGLPGCDRSTIAGHIACYINDWQVYHFHDTGESAAVKNACNINDNTRLSPTAANLAAFLYAIKDTDAYHKIVRTIQRVAPFFHSFILQPDKLNDQRIRLRWKHQGSNDYFDAHSLSDGTLRFMCLATLLLQPTLPSMILLDEPELGLHPYATQLLASLIKSASAHTQIIASTQSVTLTNEFSWQDIIVVTQDANASVFRRLDEAEIADWLENYEMGDIWQKNLIGGTPLC